MMRFSRSGPGCMPTPPRPLNTSSDTWWVKMLKPVRMCRVDCLVAQGRKGAVLDRLHREGLTQVDTIAEAELEETGMVRDQPLDRASEVSHLLSRFRGIKGVISRYHRTDSNFLDELLGVDKIEPKPVPRMGYGELKDRASSFLSQVEELVNSNAKKLADLKERKERISSRLDKLSPAAGLDVPLSHFHESHYLHSTIGLISRDSEQELEAQLKDRFQDEYASTSYVDGETKVNSYSVLKERSNVLQQVLKSNGFEELPVDGGSTFEETYFDLLSQVEEVEDVMAAAETQLKSAYEERYDELLILEELLSLEEERCNVFKRFGSTERVSYLRLWTPRRDCDATVIAVDEEANGCCYTEIDYDPEDAPTLLENHPLLRPFETFTRLYSPPRYNQMDPTLFTAPTLVLFFGYMLGDAVYGLIITLLSLMLKRKYGAYSRKVADFSFVLLCCGLSTMVFGVLSGSYLGDFLAEYVLKVETRNMFLVLIDPLYKSNAVLLLKVAVVVGVLQVILGNLLGILDKILQRDYLAALTENGSWLIMGSSVPLALYLDTTVAAITFAVGFLLLIKANGFMAFMELPGIIGRVVSYARLLALSLTTPAMGTAFNFLVALSFTIPVIGPVIAFFAFIGSHVMILFMNSLGSFVHSLRLHYVEFYGTFYGGGGVEFTPFIEKRKYTSRR
ncbi:MAG: hypothetical protein GF416_01685 [Candidatus Altiarchaeales archaeon]|nr:hypothetical protein [Candidatus Altiarchaeales archaeon]MBD3415827.1 hypothetical protein [Candidatus Altiarchaeales archaeon]